MPTALHKSKGGMTCLDHFRGSDLVPTLGEIFRSFRRDLATARADVMPLETAKGYDEAFATRPDYALWRKLFGNRHPTIIRERLPSADDLVHEGLLCLEPAVVWGTLSMTHGLATSPRGNQLFGGEPERLALEMEKAALGRGLAPLPNANAGCGLHRLLSLGAIDKIRFETTPEGTILLNQLLDYLNTIERLIIELDPSWRPGRAVSLDALYHERPIGTLGIFDLKLRLDELLFCIRGSVRHGLKDQPLTNPHVRESLARAAQFAFSSWRSTRSSRLHIARLLESGRTFRYQLSPTEEKEWRALIRAAQGAKDIGNLSLAAKLAFWALRTMPESLIRKPEFAALGDQVGFDIRQFGYEPDKRFSRPRMSRFAHSGDVDGVLPPAPTKAFLEEGPLTVNVTGNGSGVVQAEGQTDEISPGTAGAPPDPNMRRGRQVVGAAVGENYFKSQVLADQQNSDDWKVVLQKYPCNPSSPMDSLGRVVYEAVRIRDEELLRAAFRLCAFKYRLPASSAALIQHFRPRKDDVVALAALFEHVTRAMPIGMDDTVLRGWQNILRSAWYALPSHEKIYEEDILLFHEVLLGRGVAVLRASEHATQYAQQFFGDRDDTEIRHLLDCDISLLHAVKTGTHAGKLKAAVEEFAKTSMKKVVWVSVVSLTPRQWSLLIIGDNGRWHCDRLTFKSSILEEGRRISAMKGWGETWFRVPWKNASGLQELAAVIWDVVSTKYPSARYLQLAIEPRLARLPWNDLFRPLWKRSAETPVIAIVPNFTWALVANRRHQDHGLQLLVADAVALTGETASDERTAGFFTALRKQLFTSRTLLKQIYSSAVFVLARGAWNADAKMTDIAALEGTIALKHERHTDLLDLGNYRVVVFYACRAGHVAQHFLGDLGGIPGICLSLKTRLLVAPVAEISPKTVAILHKHLSDSNGPREIGRRYLEAIREERSVAHFNLFGFANEDTTPLNSGQPEATGVF